MDIEKNNYENYNFIYKLNIIIVINATLISYAVIENNNSKTIKNNTQLTNIEIKTYLETVPLIK